MELNIRASRAKNTVPCNDLAVTKVARSKVTKQTEWKVLGVRGLSIVVKPSGTATYYVRYQVGSGAKRTERREALGYCGEGGLTLAKARAMANVRMSQVEAGHDPVGEREAKAKEMTLRQLFDERCEKDDRRAPRTLDDYREVLEKYVFPDLGDVPARVITADQIADALEFIEARTKTSAHKARAALSSTYRWAISRHTGGVRVNPVAGLGFTHQSKARERVLSDDELAKLWRALDSKEFTATEPMCIILKLAILTGQRNSEVAGTRFSELEAMTTATPRWRIPAERMKRKSRLQLVPLSTQATALFSRAVELAGGVEYVFPGSTHGRRKGVVWHDKHLAQGSVSLAMARVREIAGVKDIRVHDMRKCIVTWLDENRIATADVLDRILHHGGNGVTATHYNFATLEGPVRKALQAWADHVEAVAARQKEPKANVVALAGGLEDNKTSPDKGTHGPTER